MLSALRDADVVACEDTRRTRVLLERYGVQASLISYHEHNEASRTPELVQRMRGTGNRDETQPHQWHTQKTRRHHACDCQIDLALQQRFGRAVIR